MNIKVKEVSAASEQVAAGSEEVAASVDEVEEICRQAALHFEGIASSSSMQLATMNEVSASAQAMKVMSEQLTSLIGRFKL